MKIAKRPMFFGLLFVVALLSCNNEELFVDQTSDTVVDTDTGTPSDTTSSDTPAEDTSSNTDPVTTPCDFTLDTVQAGDTVIIDCVLDLGGQTVNLPSGVTLVYNGGDIVNGTLNFSDNSVISGELLNSGLTLSGSTPQLKDTTFNFDPQRWEIIEGIVSDDVALRNRDLLEGYFNKVKSMGATTFSIDMMDAYFKVDGPLNEGVPEVHAINVPSDFNLTMSSNTHLRMQPNGHFRAVLLAVYNEKNITITGGILHGDREEHNYNSGYVDSDGSTGPTSEWVDVMRIKGGQNVTIDGVTFEDPAGDCLNIAGIYFYYDSRHIKSENITIKNCNFLRARRTNLVITSGEQIIIENNQLVDGGIDMAKSKGTAPSSNLNFEPVSGRDSNGNLIEYEHVSDVYIRNNTQIVNNKTANPNAGGFQISHGDGPIIIENNEMINSGVSFYTANGVIIRNNNIVQGGIGAGAAENFDRTGVVFNNQIIGNTVVTDKTALNIAGNGITITDNSFEGEIGVSFGAGATDSSTGASNIVFSNNTIKAHNRGITSMNTSKNVAIENNTINMFSDATFAITLTNAWKESGDANFIFKDNIITGAQTGTERGAPPSLIGANSITIENNQMGEIQINGGSNMSVFNNYIEGGIGHNGVLFYADAPNTSFIGNKITIYPSKTPLGVECVKVANNVALTSVSFDAQECIEK